MNRAYGFEGEAKHKHGEQTYKVRSYLPIQPLDFVASKTNSSFLYCLAIRACLHSS